MAQHGAEAKYTVLVFHHASDRGSPLLWYLAMSWYVPAEKAPQTVVFLMDAPNAAESEVLRKAHSVWTVSEAGGTLPDVAEVWRRGSVVGSWLLDLTAHALLQDPDVARFSGRVSDSGEGRWTVAAAVETGVPAHVLTTALYERFTSRGEADFAEKLLSAMRNEFGGHEELPTGE